MAPPRKGTLCTVWGDRGISRRQQEGGRVPGDPRPQECGNVAGAAACRNFPKYRPSSAEAARRKTQEEFGGALTLPGLGVSSPLTQPPITPKVSCLPPAAPLAVPCLPARPSCTPHPIQRQPCIPACTSSIPPPPPVSPCAFLVPRCHGATSHPHPGTECYSTLLPVPLWGDFWHCQDNPMGPTTGSIPCLAVACRSRDLGHHTPRARLECRAP